MDVRLASCDPNLHCFLPHGSTVPPRNLLVPIIAGATPDCFNASSHLDLSFGHPLPFLALTTLSTKMARAMKCGPRPYSTQINSSQSIRTYSALTLGGLGLAATLVR